MNVKKMIVVLVVGLMLVGCSKARNPQCEDLASKYDGALIGGLLVGGGYAASYRVDMAEAQLNQCEMAFDLVKQQQQNQQQMYQQQVQQQRQREAEARKRKMLEVLNSPEVQKKIRNDPLEDLVSCAKGMGGEKLEIDVREVVQQACKNEIDRRVDTGVVSRDKVDKQLNQVIQSVSLSELVECEKQTLKPRSTGVSTDEAKASYLCEKEIDRRVAAGAVSRDKVNKMLNQA